MVSTIIERELDPFPYYQKMRTSAPVAYDGERWSWSVFRYDDVQHVLSEWRDFSSQFMGPDRGENSSYPFAASMISSDPPRHRQLRNLVTQAFTPRAVESLSKRIGALVNEYLDQVRDRGEMEVIHDLAYPLPVTVIAEMLGIPAADRGRFKKWSDAVVAIGDLDNVDMAELSHNQAVMEMSQYFMGMIGGRQQQPGDDLISGLLAANIEGQHLSTIELLGFCVLLLVAGNETTTNLIGNAMMVFSEQPDAWEKLRGDSNLLPSAIEEVLRYRSPVQAMFRRSSREIALNGQTIPGASSVIAWIGSANHDPSQFQEPERFNIERAPNRHLAFGHGIHYCLGAPLARLEAKIALEAMVERFKTVARLPGVKLERQPSLVVYGVKSMPIRFTRG